MSVKLDAECPIEGCEDMPIGVAVREHLRPKHGLVSKADAIVIER